MMYLLKTLVYVVLKLYIYLVITIIYIKRYIILTESEREQLEQSYKTSTNFIEKSRSLQILLSDRKNSMAEVSSIANIDIQAVIRLFNAWESASAESNDMF
jgi:hypothetical protein